MKQVSQTYGFTLIELSVVLVIIGLIVGSVLVGEDLITAARLRAQAKQFEEYKVAVTTFRIKYDALPGDMTSDNLVGFGFDTGHGGPINLYLHCWGGWCNGNGKLDCTDCPQDGYIGDTCGECGYFFPELSAANLIEGQYKVDSNWVVGITNPPTKFNPNMGLAVNDGSKLGGGTWLLAGLNSIPAYGQSIEDYFGDSYFGSTPGSGNAQFLLTPAQAYNIDLKVDDGVPSHGNFRAIKFITVIENDTYDRYMENDDGTAGDNGVPVNCVLNNEGRANASKLLSFLAVPLSGMRGRRRLGRS